MGIFTSRLFNGSTGVTTSPDQRWAIALWPSAAGRPDLYLIKKSGTGSGKTEVHILTAASGYTQFALQTATGLHLTDETWEFGLGDYLGDGRPDLIGIKKRATGTGRTEVHIFSARSNYATPVLQTGIPVGETDAAWTFLVGDHDGGGGRPDLFVLYRNGTAR